MKPRRLWGALNGLGQATLVGAIVIVMLVVFQLFALVPWASKAEVAGVQRDLNGFKGDVRRELGELREDVREVLRLLRRP